jgi:carbamoyl-phosphate synthase large subunit
VPFVSKATAVPLAKAAARIMLGATIAELRVEGLLPAEGDGGELPVDAPIAVKEAVLPFNRFRTPAGQGVDPLLGPEMKSTGEVMGIDASFGPAFAKSQAASYGSLPTSGRVFVSVADRDKRAMVFPVRRLADLGFEVLATGGTAEVLRRHGIATTVVRKHFEGGPGDETVLDLIMDGRIDMIVNTPYGNAGPRVDGYEIRSAAVARGIPCITTVQGAAAAVQGIEAATGGGIGVRSLQDMHAALRKARPWAARRRRSGSGWRRRSACTGRCAWGSTRTRGCWRAGASPTTRTVSSASPRRASRRSAGTSRW